MAPSLTRPTDTPEWATDGGALITEPSQPKKEQGWDVEAPPVETMNWIHNITYQWTQYLDSRPKVETDPGVLGAQSGTYGYSRFFVDASDTDAEFLTVKNHHRLFGAADVTAICPVGDYVFVGTDAGNVYMLSRDLQTVVDGPDAVGGGAISQICGLGTQVLVTAATKARMYDTSAPDLTTTWTQTYDAVYGCDFDGNRCFLCGDHNIGGTHYEVWSVDPTDGMDGAGGNPYISRVDEGTDVVYRVKTDGRAVYTVSDDVVEPFKRYSYTLGSQTSPTGDHAAALKDLVLTEKYVIVAGADDAGVQIRCYTRGTYISQVWTNNTSLGATVDGLHYDGRWLYAYLTATNYLYAIDPATGFVTHLNADTMAGASNVKAIGGDHFGLWIGGDPDGTSALYQVVTHPQPGVVVAGQRYSCPRFNWVRG